MVRYVFNGHYKIFNPSVWVGLYFTIYSKNYNNKLIYKIWNVLLPYIRFSINTPVIKWYNMQQIILEIMINIMHVYCGHQMYIITVCYRVVRWKAKQWFVHARQLEMRIWIEVITIVDSHIWKEAGIHVQNLNENFFHMKLSYIFYMFKHEPRWSQTDYICTNQENQRYISLLQ